MDYVFVENPECPKSIHACLNFGHSGISFAVSILFYRPDNKLKHRLLYRNQILRQYTRAAGGCLSLIHIYPVFSPDEMQTNQHIREIYQKSGQLRWEDGKEHLLPQDYADMIGWREMARMVDNVRLKLSSEEWEQTLVICDNYCLLYTSRCV